MYKIEIQAETVSELAQRMVLMGAQLQRDTGAPAEPATKPEPKAKAKEPSKAPEQSTLNFEKDVAARVLRLVQQKGKEAATTLLSEFGASRASHVEADRWPELVSRLDEVLA